MKNFVERNNGGGYEYISVETGHGAIISAYYYKDGNPRGIVMTCNRVELRTETGHGEPYAVKTTELCTGIYLHVLPLQRKSPKSLVAFAEFIDAELPEIARTFLEGSRGLAQVEIASHIERWRTIHTQDTAKVLGGLRR